MGSSTVKYDKRYNLRRNIIKTCFGFIVFSFVYCFLFIYFGTDDMRTNLKEVTVLLIPLNTFATGLILTYMTSVHYSDKQTKEHDNV